MAVAEPTVAPPSERRLPLPSGPVLGLIGVLTLFVLLIGIKGELGAFLSVGNARVLVHEGTIPAVIALGMLLVVISGGIDLSVGAVVALVTVVCMRVYIAVFTALSPVPPLGVLAAGGSVASAAWGVEGQQAPWASLAAVACGILTGGLTGLLNGLLITRLRLPPFVVTLAMLSIARGSAIWLAERQAIAFPIGARPEWVEILGKSKLYNPGFISLIVLAALTAVLLRATVFGRHLYAVGSNESTARLCGVNVARTKVLTYTLAGLLTGWAGVLMFAHGDSGNPTAGEGLELSVIAAVVIGGASLTGGRGTVTGALVGVLILGLLRNGVSLFKVPVEIQYVLIGVIILANAALSQWRRPAGD